MGRIKIKDLPKDVKISEEEMKKMTGGGLNLDPKGLDGLSLPPGGLPGLGGGSREFDDEWL